MSDLLNQASLVYIPSGYKEDTAYSVIPTDGSGDLTFTRASDGTRVNSQGLVERVPWNLAQQSNTFNTTWTTASTYVTSGQSDKDGGTTAWLLTKTGASGYIQQNISVIGSFTQSIYAKAGALNWVRFTNSGISGADVYFDLANGVVGNTGGSVLGATITSVGNGWFFITVNYNGNGGAVRIFPADGNGSTSGTSGSIYIQDAQLNEGSTAKPYFPTTDRLNVPRLDYSGGCPSLLLEPQRTNLAFPSEDLTAWVSGGMTNTANQTTSPDGTQNADKSTIGSTTRYYDVITQGITTVSGTAYTTSFYAKKGTGIEAVYFYQGDGGRIAKWNLNTGAYIGYAPADGYNAFTSQTSESLGNGWYRFTATYTAASTSGNFTIGVSTNTNNSVTTLTGNGTDFVYVWGLQYEAGSYPTSYIPTTSASVTRVADAAYKTGISSLIGQTEGTLFVDCERIGPSGFDPENLIFIGDGGLNNFINIIYDISTSRYIGQVRAGGTTNGSVTATQAFTGRFKIAIAYASNDLVMYINGVQQAVDTSVTIPSTTLSFLGLGGYYDGSYGDAMKGLYSQAVLFKTRLTNAELAALTTL